VRDFKRCIVLSLWIRFEEVRIPRLRRIQAYAAELTGFRELIPDWVLELPLEEKLRRSSEFSEWTQTYPKNITGDAASTYWKPWILMVVTFHQLETKISQYSQQLDFCTHSLLKTSLKLWIKMWVQEDFETVLQIYTKYDCSWVKDFGSTSIQKTNGSFNLHNCTSVHNLTFLISWRKNQQILTLVMNSCAVELGMNSIQANLSSWRNSGSG
jgi:hypothetical protein